jgi:hypothetical protein
VLGAISYLLGCVGLYGQTYQYKIGEQVVHIPTPQGFEMSQGLNPAFDQFGSRTIGSNKVITFFTDQKTHASLLAQQFPADGSVIFSAHYESGMENAEVSEKEFNDVASGIKKQWSDSGILSPKVLENIQNNLDEAGKKLSGFTGKLQLEKPVILGVFEALPNSLVGGMLYSVSVNGKKTQTTCVICSFNRAADRILLLYCSVPYNSAKDVKYALSIFKPWRDETLSLNPNSNYPGHDLVASAQNSGLFKGLPEAAVRGGLIGIMFGLGGAIWLGVGWVWKKLFP